ncbi:unnamed protein product, partial [Linum tenue]
VETPQAHRRPQARHRVLRRHHQAQQEPRPRRVQVPPQGHGLLRHRRGDLRPAHDLRGSRGEPHPPQRPPRDGRVLPRHHRQAPRLLQRQARRNRPPPRQRLDARRRPFPHLPHRQPLQDAGRRQDVQSHRYGLQRQLDLRRHCVEHLACTKKQGRPRRHFRVAQPQLVPGNERSMILANCLFRSGGCAILLTNKRSLRHRCIFKLNTLVRTHHGGKEDSYGCCIQKEDEQGRLGFHLAKNLLKAATRAFVDNLREISPKILPVRELVRFVAVYSMRGKPPVINFKTVVEHFCIHSGGKAVIDGIGASLEQSEHDLDLARMTLHRWGNTKSKPEMRHVSGPKSRETFTRGVSTDDGSLERECNGDSLNRRRFLLRRGTHKPFFIFFFSLCFRRGLWEGMWWRRRKLLFQFVIIIILFIYFTLLYCENELEMVED